jgi:uncharacterized protein (DUF488 family)
VERAVYTIGHSNHPLTRFLQLLRVHRIDAIGDVRSAPYSRRHPWFGREALQRALHAHGIAYVFLGASLGARPSDPECTRDGRVSFARLAETPTFRAGLDRVLRGSASHRLALLCAEKEPLHCHRAILVGRELARRGARILHILGDGSLERHEESERRLLALVGLSQGELFEPPEALLARAYDLQGARIAWVRPLPYPPDSTG